MAAYNVCRTCGKTHTPPVQQCDCGSVDLRLEDDAAERASQLPPIRPLRGRTRARDAQTDNKSFDAGAIYQALKSIQGKRARRKPRMIALFGHSMSGKTWFLHRAKLLRFDMGYNEVVPLPKHAPDKEEGLEIPGTKGLELHNFRKSAQDIITVADIVGEQFSAAFAEQLRGAGRLHAFLDVLARADGYIFMLPAAETLTPNLAERCLEGVQKGEERERLGQLLNSVRCVAAVAEHVRKNKLPEAEIAKAMREIVDTPGKLDELLEGDAKTRRPALILFTKADEYEKCIAYGQRLEESLEPHARSLETLPENYDKDPVAELANCSGDARALLDQFGKTFCEFRVDFVTAFHGHEQRAGANKIVDPDLDCYGVREAMEWMRGAIDRSRSRIRLPVPHTSFLISLRRRFDAEFDSIFQPST